MEGFRMVSSTYETTERGTIRDKRVGIIPMVLTALLTFALGFLTGQSTENNNKDVLPGGAPTDSVSGPTQSDR
jgi:hypothetical protein